jgi:hypothetical protein
MAWRRRDTCLAIPGTAGLVAFFVTFLPGGEPPWGYLVMVPTTLDASGVALPAPACSACLHSADLHETIMGRVRQHFPEIKLATGGMVQ